MNSLFNLLKFSNRIMVDTLIFPLVVWVYMCVHVYLLAVQLSRCLKSSQQVVWYSLNSTRGEKKAVYLTQPEQEKDLERVYLQKYERMSVCLEKSMYSLQHFSVQQQPEAEKSMKLTSKKKMQIYFFKRKWSTCYRDG